MIHPGQLAEEVHLAASADAVCAAWILDAAGADRVELSGLPRWGQDGRNRVNREAASRIAL